MRESNISLYAIVAAMVALVIGLVWIYAAGPCWLFRWEPLKDIPGRCIEGLELRP